MKRNGAGLSLVTLMVSVAVIALVLRYSIEGMMSRTIAANESNAQSRLKLIAAALEGYAKDHQSAYPASLSKLSENTPPYLDKNYPNVSLEKGYVFSCNYLDKSGYSCMASPRSCNLSGAKEFTVSTGGLLVSQPCEKNNG